MPQPLISHQFGLPVWRFEIDSQNDAVLIELRDQSEKKVSFASISLKSGQVYFDGLETEERWLTGIEAAYDGVLLLHTYQSESGPTHKGLIALDVFTGEALWSNFNLSFDYLSINGPVVYDTRFQPRKLILADIKSGATTRKHEPSIDLELSKELQFPEAMADEFALSIHLEVKPLENSVHYLEHYNLRIVSLHAITEGRLQQHLYVMNNTDIVFEDLLNTGIQKLQPESFLLYKNHLIYLKNRSQLKVLNLNTV
ncbi:MAG: DUF4905 domain-containing protein [Mucilaginibacter sp.]